jgi:hypothetical protein
MARAAEEGVRVFKPHGDCAKYDVGVEYRGRFLRVQVKSTIFKRRGEGYSLNVMGPKRKRYESGVLDFFAVYLIPIDAWYIIPYELTGWKNCTLHFTPNSPRHKYRRYREAWHLLRGEGRIETLHGCAEEESFFASSGVAWPSAIFAKYGEGLQ